MNMEFTGDIPRNPVGLVTSADHTSVGKENVFRTNFKHSMRLLYVDVRRCTLLIYNSKWLGETPSNLDFNIAVKTNLEYCSAGAMQEAGRSSRLDMI